MVNRIIPSRSCFGPPDCKLIHNPTFWLFIFATTVLSIGAAGFLLGKFPAYLTIILNVIALYFGFTVLHDGVHGSIHCNPVIGNTMARIWGFFLTFTFPFFRSVHNQHHAHTNISQSDPDYVLAKLPNYLAPLLGGVMVYAAYSFHFFGRKLWRNKAELFEVVFSQAFYLGLLLASILGGWAETLVILWIFPLCITLALLTYTFDYLPHLPHDSADRYYIARAYGGRTLTFLMCAQNYHLVHHLWPKIPWHKYPIAFRQVNKDLAAKGCRLGYGIKPLRF